VLPLQGLAGGATQPLLLFVLVWSAAGLALGAIARAVRLERLTAAIVLLFGVGLSLFAFDAISIFVVRQGPFARALDEAAHVRAMFLAAALAGGAGALLGRAQGGRSKRAPAVLAGLVAFVGCLDILSAVTPEIRGRLAAVERFAPDGIPRVASALVAAGGLILLLAARRLSRRSRRAWQLAVLLLGASLVLHLLKGLDYEEVLGTVPVLLALVARRRDFDASGDPSTRGQIAVRAAVFVASIYAYGVVALLINRALVDQPFSIGFPFSQTTRALLGLSITGSPHVAGSFGRWFPLSVLILGITCLLWTAGSWLAPWRYRLGRRPGDEVAARDLVAAWGADTLAPFTLRGDKSYFFSEDDAAFLAYRTVAGVAIVSGDPVGPEHSIDSLLDGFADFVRRRGWRLAVLGASERLLAAYGARGLHSLYWGDEAMIETASFSLEGRAVRKVRQSVHRVERSGFTVDVRFARDVDDELRDELAAVYSAWRADRPQRGFVMELDHLFRLDGDDAVFAVGRGPDGSPRGFLHLAVCRASRTLSLSVMPRSAGVPNGFNEWLICMAVAWAGSVGFERLSLNFAPFAAVLDGRSELSRTRRLQRSALLALKSPLHFQLDNLLMFNGQFRPQWQSRYVVYERWRDLPRVGFAGLAAEGYLPLRIGLPRPMDVTEQKRLQAG
jgi:lysyl-tRNA synthetase class 2